MPGPFGLHRARRLRRSLPWGLGCLGLLLCGAAPARAQGLGPGGAGLLRIDALAGPEYDSNVRREAAYAPSEDTPQTASEAQEADALARVLLRGDLQSRLGPRSRMNATLDLGAKRFFEQREEDTLILQGGLTWQQAVASSLGFSLGINLKDRRQPDERRSYRSGALNLGVSLPAPPGFGLALGGQLRAFRYLPDPSYDHAGLGAVASLSWRSQRLRVQGSLSGFLLDFEGVRRTRSGAPDPDGTLRQDRMLRGELDLDYLGPVLVGLEAYAQLTRSDSSGSGHRRAGAEGAFALALPWSLDLSLRGSLLLTRYDDPTVVPDTGDPTFGVEDEETRSSLGLALRRTLGWGVDLELRGSRYFSLGQGPEYHRDVVLCGLRYGTEL